MLRWQRMPLPSNRTLYVACLPLGQLAAQRLKCPPVWAECHAHSTAAESGMSGID